MNVRQILILGCAVVIASMIGSVYAVKGFIDMFDYSCMSSSKHYLEEIFYENFDCFDCGKHYVGTVRTSCRRGVREIDGPELDSLDNIGYMTEDGISIMADSGWEMLANVRLACGREEMVRVGIPSIADRMRALDLTRGVESITAVILDPAAVPFENRGLVVPATLRHSGLPIIYETEMWEVLNRCKKSFYRYHDILLEPFDR